MMESLKDVLDPNQPQYTAFLKQIKSDLDITVEKTDSTV